MRINKEEFAKEFAEKKVELQEYINDEYDHMEERYGIIDNKEKELMLAYFLYNCHDTISSIASEFCNLSKSTYEKSVYIDKINETQQEHYESYHYDDIMDFLKSGDVTKEDMIEFIDGYFNNRT